MGVVVRKGTDFHAATGHGDATWCRLPVGRGVDRAHDPAQVWGEVVHQIGQLHGKIATLWPPPAVHLATPGVFGHAQSQGRAKGKWLGAV